MAEDLFDIVRFDQSGLAPAVIQDVENGEVLMVAYMNREALRRTLETGRVTFWSRSRQELWVKGATSGHAQHLRELRIDCDGDCILVRVEQVGAACHTGYRSCFSRRSDSAGQLEQVGDPMVDMTDMTTIVRQNQ